MVQYKTELPMQGAQVQSLVRELGAATIVLEKEMATHSSILAWRIPRTQRGDAGDQPPVLSQRAPGSWTQLGDAGDEPPVLSQSAQAHGHSSETLGMNRPCSPRAPAHGHSAETLGMNRPGP